MPVISVIVPIYKVEPYLRYCIDSILSQTFTDFELILVDDGSPDNCGKICDEYSLKDNRIIVLHKVNGGLSSARNVGLDYIFEKSNSKYISFIDGDDVVDRLFLEHLYVAVQNSCEMSICYYASFSTDECLKLPIHNFLDNHSYWDLLKSTNGLTINCTCKLFKKSLFDNIRFPQGRLFEDSFVIHELVSKCSKISVVYEFLYFYRVLNNSISHSFDKKRGTIDSLECKINRTELYFNKQDAIMYPKTFEDCFDYLLYSFRKYGGDKETKKFLRQVFNRLKKVYFSCKNTSIDTKGFKYKFFFRFPSLYILLLSLKREKA